MNVQEVFQNLRAADPVGQALTYLKSDHENRMAEQMLLADIPSYNFGERQRVDYCKQCFEACGLDDITVDAAGNLCGRIPGSGQGPKILVEAHVDTVFPAGTKICHTRREDGVYVGPGVADDASGAAAILSVIRACRRSGIFPVGDLLFCMTVGEEGLGDLRGMKHFFREHEDIAAAISVDVTGVNGIVYQCVGSHRYEVNFKGPGGHSHGNFGTPSAIHAMGRAIAKIADVKTPEVPRTTYTVGVVSGGTSVNSIAEDARMLVDIRSGGHAEMLAAEREILECIHAGTLEENKRWGSEEAVAVDMELIGERPAGAQPADALIVQAAVHAIRAVGQQECLCRPSSTNTNVPVSLGIPAITLTSGGKSDKNHSMEEWFDPADAYLGPQFILLTALGLAGLTDVTQPLLPK